MSVARKLRVLPFRHSGDVQRVCDFYLKALSIRVRAGGVCKVTLDQATHYLGSFSKMHGAKSIEDCRSTDVLEWILAHPEWQSTHTKIDAAKHVVSAFNAAADEGLIARKPYRRPKGIWESPQPRRMLPEEYGLIQQVARQFRGRMGVNGMKRRRLPSAGRFRSAMFFLWETGARTCEMRVADVSHYDRTGNSIILPPDKHKTGKKTGNKRIIPLNKAGRLVRWLCRGRTSGPIFLASWGGRGWGKDNFAKVFRKFARLAGVRDEVTAYCTRHGFTCRLKQLGVDSLQVAHLLGQTTARYVESTYGKGLLEDAAYLASIRAKLEAEPKPPQQ